MKWPKLSKNQEQTLMRRFQTKPYPTMKERYQLAISLNTTRKNSENWFRQTRHTKAAEGLLNLSE